jgi:hypothetical protein
MGFGLVKIFDAIALLKADHRKVEELFDEFEAAKGAAKKLQAQAHGLQMSRIPSARPPNGRTSIANSQRRYPCDVSAC